MGPSRTVGRVPSRPKPLHYTETPFDRLGVVRVKFSPWWCPEGVLRCCRWLGGEASEVGRRRPTQLRPYVYGKIPFRQTLWFTVTGVSLVWTERKSVYCWSFSNRPDPTLPPPLRSQQELTSQLFVATPSTR